MPYILSLAQPARSLAPLPTCQSPAPPRDTLPRPASAPLPCPAPLRCVAPWWTAALTCCAATPRTARRAARWGERPAHALLCPSVAVPQLYRVWVSDTVLCGRQMPARI